MLQKLMAKKEKGFTLIELMIVIAIIGILAAIAVPQFLTYRLRSYNAAAKAIVHNLKADNGNLNAELGAFGGTEAAAVDLRAAAAAPGVANATSLADGGVPELRLAATDTHIGARLSGTHGSRDYSVAISLGDNMIASALGGAQFIVLARHFKGDTAYGIDSDVENQLFAVSNPTWPSHTPSALEAIEPQSNSDEDDFTGFGGGGRPTTTWERLN